MTTNRWSTQAPARDPSNPAKFHGDWKSRFLRGLASSDLQLVMAPSTPRHFKANSIVIHQGDLADHFFLLTRGCARHFSITEEGRKVLLLWLAPGDIFGGSSLLGEPSLYLFSTEMVKDSSVLVWRRSVMRELVASFPRLQENALSLASDYLTWFHASHLALVSYTARQRLARVLTSLAQGIGHKVPAGIELDITNEQLANAANVTPFTASRLLSEWQRNGAVTKRRGSVVVRAPERLFLHQV
jgi:CRP/FNR family transcriptional regulator, nitrogen oxide reductase regulator